MSDLEPGEKIFFIKSAIGAGELSECEPGHGATIARHKQILSFGFNQKIIRGEQWELSAIQAAVLECKDLNLGDVSLFSTYFPTLDDLKMLVSVKITSVYYLGEAEDKSEIKHFLNKLCEKSIPLEIIHLEGKKSF
jgi:deoxycytidylate deaminase